MLSLVARTWQPRRQGCAACPKLAIRRGRCSWSGGLELDELEGEKKKKSQYQGDQGLRAHESGSGTRAPECLRISGHDEPILLCTEYQGGLLREGWWWLLHAS